MTRDISLLYERCVSLLRALVIDCILGSAPFLKGCVTVSGTPQAHATRRGSPRG
jgi:hypothetical protein